MVSVAGNPILHVKHEAGVTEFLAEVKVKDRVRLTVRSRELGAVYCLREMQGELFYFDEAEAERLRLICNSNSWGECGRQFVATVVRAAPTLVATIIGRQLESIELLEAA